MKAKDGEWKFGGRRLGFVADALWLEQNEVDLAFGEACRRAEREEWQAKRDERRAYLKEHGAKAKRKRYLAERESQWRTDTNLIEAKDSQRRRMSAKKMKRAVPNQSKRLPPLESSKKQGTRSLQVGSKPETFEGFLKREALMLVVQREGMLEKLREEVRPFQASQKSLANEDKVQALVDELRELTVRIVLAISKWAGCFVAPTQFIFKDRKQEPVDYLLAIVQGMDFLALRPGVVALLRRRAVHGSVSLKRNPFVLLGEPSSLEKDALEILEEQEKVFGLLPQRRCTWCGFIPELPKSGGQELVSCTDQFCERAKFCEACIKVNCGGLRGYNLIKVQKSWSCFLCIATKLEFRAEEKKLEKEKAKQAMQRQKIKDAEQLRKRKELQSRLPHLVLARKKALRILSKKVKRARKHVQAQSQARSFLKACALKAFQCVKQKQVALRWLADSVSSARKACIEQAAMLLEDHDVTLNEPDQGRQESIPQRMKLSSNSSSLDLFEEAARERQAQEAEQQQQQQQVERHSQVGETWEAFGNRAQFRFAARILYNEICLVDVRSTERNPEIVQVTAFVPSTQRCIGKVLLHKSQVRRHLWRTELLRTVRDKATQESQKDALASLQKLAARAKHLLEHHRKQFHTQVELKTLACRYLRIHADQWVARSWLVENGTKVVNHLENQKLMRKQFRFQVRRAWSHFDLQATNKQALAAKAARARDHLELQHVVQVELVALSNHVKVHLFSQARSKASLRALATSVFFDQQPNE